MKKLLSVLALSFLCLGVLPGASSCEQKLDQAVGVPTQVDPTTKQLPPPMPIAQTPAGEVVSVGSAVANAVAPGTGTIVSLAGNVILGLLASILYKRQQNANSNLSSTQQALGLAQTAINATASGLQQAVNVLPAAQAKTLATIIDVAHDAANVAGHLQDAIQPNLDTAGQHAVAPAAPGTPTV